MKAFEEKHETILNYYFSPIDNNCENGKETLHKASVDSVSFFTEIEENIFKRISLNKSFIIDMYNKIQEIEEQTTMQVWYDVPF